MKNIFFLLLLFFIIFPKSVVLANTPGSTPIPTVDYPLPYPGLLPDNPLYFLKMIRDQIVMFFISDPVKKSEFSLMQSDKRIAAARSLLSEHQASKDPLALSTLTKSTNYLFTAVGEYRSAAASGENVADLPSKLHDAILKHEAVIATLATTPGLSGNATLTEEERRLADLEKTVSEFGKK